MIVVTLWMGSEIHNDINVSKLVWSIPLHLTDHNFVVLSLMEIIYKCSYKQTVSLTIKKIIVVSNKKEGPNSYLVMTFTVIN